MSHRVLKTTQFCKVARIIIVPLGLKLVSDGWSCSTQANSESLSFLVSTEACGLKVSIGWQWYSV